MSYQNLKIESENGIVRLTLNQPDTRNAMTPQMGEELQAAVAEINENQSSRVVVVTGAGKSFSAGGNLKSLQEEASAGSGKKSGEGIGGGRNFYRLFLTIRDLEVPSIAAINGHAIGAGFCFALGCDMRVVHERAKLGMTFVRLGIHPGMAATWNLPRLIGPARAAELLYTGRLISGAEAVALGIASRVAGDDFKSVVTDLAEEVAAAAPIAVRALKQTLRGTFDRDLDEAIGVEADVQAMTFKTSDAMEGIRAIQERRPPVFHGK